MCLGGGRLGPLGEGVWGPEFSVDPHVFYVKSLQQTTRGEVRKVCTTIIKERDNAA